MSGLRFSIANLLTATAFICVSLAALKSDSGTVAGLAMLGTVGVLGTAATASILGQAESRAFWLGVLIFGVSYFVVVYSAAFPEAKAEIKAPLFIFYSKYWAATIPSWNNAFGATLNCIVNLTFAWSGGIISRCWYAWSRRLNEPSQ